MDVDISKEREKVLIYQLLAREIFRILVIDSNLY